MAQIINGADNNYLLKDDNRVFIQSKNINIFPCSRRGQYSMQDSARYYDPEARLNTERTNRLRTSLNGFKDQFIKDFTNGALKFVLAGYYIEAQNIDPLSIASALEATDADIIYAHLSLHDGISLDIEGYFTEILYRQSNSTTNISYLDVPYTDENKPDTAGDFFVGVSFVKELGVKDRVQVTDGATTNNKDLVSHDLPIFQKSGSGWNPVQTSFLPKIEHDSTEKSIKITGDFAVDYGTGDNEQIAFKVENSGVVVNRPVTSDLAVKHGEQESFKVTTDSTKIGVPTTVIGDFEVQHTIDGQNDNQSSFKVTQDKILLGPTDISDLTAGKLKVIDGNPEAKFIVASNSEGHWGAKFAVPVTVTNELEVTASVNTPVINVKTIENTADDAGVSINDTLNITSGHSVVADSLKVMTITSNDAEVNVVKADSKLTVTDIVTLNKGLNVTDGKTTLQKLTAKETNLDNLAIAGEAKTGSVLTVNGKSTIKGDLEVTVKTSTPTLEVSTITSSSEGIVVDKDLTISNLKPLTVTGDTQLQTVTVNGLTDNLLTQLNQLQVSDTATINGLTKANEIDAAQITANEIWLDTVDNKIIGQVPALELVHLTKTDTYQVRFKFGTPITIIEE